MTINLNVPQKQYFKPTITVVGVGGAGGNAVNNMISSNLEGVNFVIANTDAQSLEQSLSENRIQLGANITQGLGAGSYPEVGRAAAEEAEEEILDYLQGRNMVFITAGMGGGTGTGAAPVVARIAREQGILTVAVVTKPFHFEGTHRMRVAELGIQELQKYVDTMIVIPNQNLFRIADKNTTFLDAFKMADEVLHSGVRGITDLMVMPGLINLDFSDVRAVMGEMGKAMMGTGLAEGERRALAAAEAAIANPLLDNVSMKGARGVLINITGGPDLTLFEVDEAANRIRDEVDPEANIIFGSTFDKNLQGKVRVSVVATGIETAEERKAGNATAQIASGDRKVVQMPKREKTEEKSQIKETAADKEASIPSERLVRQELLQTQQNNITSETIDNAIRKAASASRDTARNDAFITPEPVEPKSQQKELLIEQNRTDWELRQPEQKQAMSSLFDSASSSTKQRASGLFGGLFGGKKPEEPFKKPVENRLEQQSPAHPQSQASTQPGPAQPAEQAKERDVLTLEDELDIPAFLRRK